MPVFATTAEAEAWASAEWSHITWDFAGMDVSLARDVLVEFQRLAEEWPPVAQRLRYVGTYRTFSKASLVGQGNHRWSRAYAHASRSGTRIGLNPRWWKSRATIQRSMNQGVAAGWHPPGTHNPVSVFTHEFGHQIENWLNTYTGRSFTGIQRGSGFGDVRDTWLAFRAANKATAQLSLYALTNEAEAWAESFAALRYTPRAQWTPHTQHLEVLLREVQNAMRNPPTTTRLWQTLTTAERQAATQRLEALAQAMGISQW